MPLLWESIKAGDLPLCDAVLALVIIVDVFLPVPVGIVLFISLLTLWGHIGLWFFYRHAVLTIFNAKVPTLQTKAYWNSYWEFYKLIRPLEASWRALTARFRRLPDVLVLGEVRCGTTTLCAHISSLPGCQAPFCPWKHPELDRKETFYFAGHYFGVVLPQLYRLCFPFEPFYRFPRLSPLLATVSAAGAAVATCLAATAAVAAAAAAAAAAVGWGVAPMTQPLLPWLPFSVAPSSATGLSLACASLVAAAGAVRVVGGALLSPSSSSPNSSSSSDDDDDQGPSAFTFDGCAQYLSSPTAASLLAQTYAWAGEPPPVLIACVRDPTQQALSWWRYENGAIAWGKGMGLTEPNSALRGPGYPPATIGKALAHSTSRPVRVATAAAAALFPLPPRAAAGVGRDSATTSSEPAEEEEQPVREGGLGKEEEREEEKEEEGRGGEVLEEGDYVWVEALLASCDRPQPPPPPGDSPHSPPAGVEAPPKAPSPTTPSSSPTTATTRSSSDTPPSWSRANVAKFTLPPWSMSWPGGQLAGVGRNGRFAANILRVERAFERCFPPSPAPPPASHGSAAPPPLPPTAGGGAAAAGPGCAASASRGRGGGGERPRLRFVTVVNLHELGDPELLRALLKKVAGKIEARAVAKSALLAKAGRGRAAGQGRGGTKWSVPPNLANSAENTSASASGERLDRFVDAYVEDLLGGQHRKCASSPTSVTRSLPSGGNSGESVAGAGLLQRNAGTSAGVRAAFDAESPEEVDALMRHFTGEQGKLEALLGTSLPW